ncbi:hypothetical protein HZH66_007564 [Vespula vulgaris]|uniref:Uncharacterized protein n=1 Tax=Vespula vulgaris TaxID=7454 RepID=A0A834JZW1_VESVU|nr:hypothetical protein HZH66_007564 [Vespula vulgaris]
MERKKEEVEEQEEDVRKVLVYGPISSRRHAVISGKVGGAYPALCREQRKRKRKREAREHHLGAIEAGTHSTLAMSPERKDAMG